MSHRSSSHVSRSGHQAPHQGGLIRPHPKPASGQPSQAALRQPKSASSTDAVTGKPTCGTGRKSAPILGDTRPAGYKEEKEYVAYRDKLLAKGQQPGLASEKAKKHVGLDTKEK